MHLLFGIGNPGPGYALTRHNLGFMVVDLLAVEADVAWKRATRLNADLATLEIAGREVLAVKPLTYVNRCGPVLRTLLEEHGLPPEHALVVVDDLALPPGRLRLRPGGSDGGHKGLRSIAERLETETFPRLRIGVGDPGPRPAEEYVLEPLPEAERPLYRAALDRAAEAVGAWLEQGMEKAMAEVNRRDLDQQGDPP